ncbi:serine hydrolase domain-containing protein [Pseudarthrobacter sp. J75]|uniref:serine hydrolase domain-containing protein n=1 Tax=unclassified Pseudarthrobacter TaxID=2647000 RepID=UPI002E8138A1|nr:MULTISPECIES: serine hydrolase domain-containing protein [unclassified Pseudarthrobacter]MEE2523094.1 serine hydrolase domain-containing protein [Pseudarthrobacter sp. J47]MEE2529777.1 serine hydrolase domain-containing protein [Pseudarthrobacter sp. J75]MEE2569093.1 serine hydrolase domain-containing protein [Pseudarthrobacter sp. J64]
MHTSHGTVLPGFEAVQELFEFFLANDPDYSAQVAVYQHGRRVVHLHGGPHIAADSITGAYSCSKGIAAMVIALLVRDGSLDLDQPVAHYWPEFAAAGKHEILVRAALSHQAGVLGVPGGIPLDRLHTSEAAAMLAAAEPLWRPGNGTFGYHAITIGVLMEELCRRVTGSSLQQTYDGALRIPYGIDFFLGLPEDQEPRYRDVLYEPTDQWIDPLGYEGLNSNIAAGTIMELPNRRTVRAGGMSAAGGVGSADGLARAYAAVSTGVETEEGHLAPALDDKTIRVMAEEQVWGLDRSSGLDNAFAIVFMKPHPSRNFGSHLAFGHEGANAALGFADPAYGLSFGYVPQWAEEGRTQGRAHQLAAAARRAASAVKHAVEHSVER